VKGLLTLLICALLSTLISLGINHFFTPSPNWWYSIIFYLGVFAAMNIIFSLKSSPASHAETVFGTIMVKTILLLFTVFLYSLYDKAGLKAFSVHFIAHYILFTVFEIRYLLGVIKNK